MPKSTNFGASPTSTFTACCKLAVLTVCVLPMLLVQIVCMKAMPNYSYVLPMIFHRMLLRLLKVQVRMHGTVAEKRPILFVANHSSYLDIPVLGSLIKTSFIAKSEVNDWPVIGMLARMQNTMFVERRTTRAMQHRDELGEQLAKGHNLVLFAEGTSSDGMHPLPFKSSLFSIAEHALTVNPFTLQPLSITCTELDGLPLTRAWRPFYAWYGDMTLAKHLWNVFKFGHFTVDVVFHEPVDPTQFANRKALALYCQEQVNRGIEQQLTRRPDGMGHGHAAIAAPAKEKINETVGAGHDQ